MEGRRGWAGGRYTRGILATCSRPVATAYMRRWRRHELHRPHPRPDADELRQRARCARDAFVDGLVFAVFGRLKIIPGHADGTTRRRSTLPSILHLTAGSMIPMRSGEGLYHARTSRREPSARSNAWEKSSSERSTISSKTCAFPAGEHAQDVRHGEQQWASSCEAHRASHAVDSSDYAYCSSAEIPHGPRRGASASFR